MSVSYQYPSGYNTFIPTTDANATGALVVEFSRALDKFHINKYTQLQQVTLEAGKYWRFDQNTSAKALTADGSQYIWADGADRPAQNMWYGFELPSYTCTRQNVRFLLGDLATYHAKKAGGVDLVAINDKAAAAIAMLQRTRKALSRLLDTSASGSAMPYVNVLAGTSGNGAYWTPVAGQYWNTGNNTTAQQAYFRLGVNQTVAGIVQITNGQVQPKDICMVMGPDTAVQLGACLEVMDYVKQSPFAQASLMQDATYSQYGLASMMYGVQVIIEDSAYISSNPFIQAGSNLSQTRKWTIPYGTIIFCARPGTIEGSYQSYATCMGFFLEEMTVETFDEPKHRYADGNVVENFDYQIVAPITGTVAQHVISGS